MAKRDPNSVHSLTAALEIEYADYMGLRSRMPESDSRVQGVVLRFRDALRRYEAACQAELSSKQLVLA
jgi:hypothetical protein